MSVHPVISTPFAAATGHRPGLRAGDLKDPGAVLDADELDASATTRIWARFTPDSESRTTSTERFRAGRLWPRRSRRSPRRRSHQRDRSASGPRTVRALVSSARRAFITRPAG